MERDLRAKLPDGRFDGTSRQRSAVMRAIKGRDNRTTERRLRLALVRAALTGWVVRPKGVQGNPDFWFEAARAAVFVDGCFWHGCPTCMRMPKSHVAFWAAKIERNRAKDLMVARTLGACGVNVIRIWEHELKQDLPACVARIKSATSLCAT